MAIPLRQSTAGQKVLLGMFLDSNDGTTPETALSITNTDIKMWKHGATVLSNKNSGGATHIADGLYCTVLDATDTDTPGSLIVHCNVSGALPVRALCTVLPANIYDSLLSSDKLEVDIVQVAAAVIADIDDFKTDISQLTGAVGLNTTVITINDGTNLLNDVSIAIYDSTNTILITSATTDVNGTAMVYLDDGTYKVRLQKSFIVFTNPETLTVSGDTIETFIGEATSIEVPISSEVCRIYEYCYAADGATPLSTVTATATLRSTPYNYSSKLHSILTINGTYNATTGLLYWDIVRGAIVNFVISQFDINITAMIPNLTTKRLFDLKRISVS
jgi:hypothetical protein